MLSMQFRLLEIFSDIFIEQKYIPSSDIFRFHKYCEDSMVKLWMGNRGQQNELLA